MLTVTLSLCDDTTNPDDDEVLTAEDETPSDPTTMSSTGADSGTGTGTVTVTDPNSDGTTTTDTTTGSSTTTQGSDGAAGSATESGSVPDVTTEVRSGQVETGREGRAQVGNAEVIVHFHPDGTAIYTSLATREVVPGGGSENPLSELKGSLTTTINGGGGTSTECTGFDSLRAQHEGMKGVVAGDNTPWLPYDGDGAISAVTAASTTSEIGYEYVDEFTKNDTSPILVGSTEYAEVRLKASAPVTTPVTRTFILKKVRNNDSAAVSAGAATNGTTYEVVQLEIPVGETKSEVKKLDPPVVDGQLNEDELQGFGVVEISFGGSEYLEIKPDTGKFSYSAPHWVDSNGDGVANTDSVSGEKNYPVGFPRNTRPKIGGKFKVSGVSSGQTVEIRGQGSAGISVPVTALQVAVDGTITLPLTQTQGQFPNTIEFYNADDNTAFKIEWEFKTGKGEWVKIATSKHTVYVTRAKPIKTANGLMRETLFNLGCRNAKGKGADTQPIVDAIYADFKDRDVQRVKPSSGSIDGKKMTYWGTVPRLFTTQQLLENGDGRCNAWAYFFTDVLRCQGIDSEVIEFSGPPPPQLVVKEYSDAFKKRFGIEAADQNFDSKFVFFVKNWTLGGDRFSPTDKLGIPAQGNPDPPSVFVNHVVVKFGNKFYDPSYGTNVFASHKEWEDSMVDAFGVGIAPKVPLPGGTEFWIWKADPKGSTETILKVDNY